jgi:hypothetical protein
MNRTLLSTTALTGLLCFATVFAQDGVNFSGTWVKDPQVSESLGQAPASAAQTPMRLVIEQSPNAVRITRQRLNGQSDSVTYSFNPIQSALPTATTGIPAPVAPPGTTGNAAAAKNGTNVAAPSGAVATNARAEWKDDGLMLLTVLSVSGQAVTTTERLTMSPDNRKLVVETYLMVHHGYESTGGVANTSSASGSKAKDVYTKAKE